MVRDPVVPRSAEQRDLLVPTTAKKRASIHTWFSGEPGGCAVPVVESATPHIPTQEMRALSSRHALSVPLIDF